MKKTNANANAIAKDQKQLESVNLNQFADRLKGIDLKVKKSKETIYIYPDGWTKEKINSDEGKRFRNGLRNRLKSLCNNILYYAKTQDLEKLQDYAKQFDSFYKKNYRINDLSISSITNSEKREKDIELMIEILKSIK